MSRQTWQETLMVATGDGTAHGNSTTATSLLLGSAAHAKLSLPPAFFYVGAMFHVWAAGRISNIVTTPGTLTLELRLGPTSAIVAFTTAAMQLSTTAHTNVPWVFEATMTCRAVGTSTSANLMGQGEFHSQAASLTAVADSTTTPADLLAPNSAPAVGTGFDSTVTNIVDLFATWSVANAGNTLQLHQYRFTALN